MVRFCGDLRAASAEEISTLARQSLDGTVPCLRVQREDNGDVRYWDVADSSNAFLQSFLAIARRESTAYFGRPDTKVILMVNRIDADKSPTGSGGGWHVDSVRPQCKLFCYLTDCLSTEQGPLCLLTHRYRWFEKSAIYVNRLIGGGSRFSERSVGFLTRIGFREKPVLAEKGLPFFVETNRIHRGLPISNGCRAMLTAYIYPGEIPASTLSRLAPPRPTT